MTQSELVAFLKAEGYFNIRELPDGIVCNIDMLFTRAVIIEPNEYGYERRYCYEDRTLAQECCLSMKSVDDPPLPGFTAIK